MNSIIAKTLAYFIGGLAAFFLPILWSLIVVAIFVGVDTITGVMAAGKVDVKNITSKKMFSLVPKITFYLLLVITAHACSYVDSQIPFVKLALIGIGAIEIKSIDENFEKLYGYSFVNKILSALKALSKINRS